MGLPALRLGRKPAPDDPEAARVQSFFAILASMEDTNVLHRGGAAGSRYAQEAAAGFLEQGGVGGTRPVRVGVQQRVTFRRHCSPAYAIGLED